jgi:ABC-2 type transport system permease protein
MMTHYEKWVSYKTIVNKDTRRFLRLWVQTLLPSVVTTVLYFVIFGYALGGMLKTEHNIGYASFIAPGLIMLAMVNSSFSGTSFSFFLAKFNKTIDEIIVSPTPLWLVLIAYMSIGVVRGVLTSLIVAGISWLFTGFHLYSFFLTFLLLLLTGLIFSCVGIISAIYSDNFDQVSVLPNFVLTPLIYLGGVFYSISRLPEVWKYLSMCNPIYYIVNAFRYALLGVQTDHLLGSMLAIVGMIVVFFIIAVKLFDSKVGVRP